MENFFRNIKINYEEFVEKLKLTDKKVIITTVVSIIIAIILIISIPVIANERNKPGYSDKKTAKNYITQYADFNYYDAYSYTIIGKDGVDKYIENNFLSELKNGECTSDEAIAASNNIAIAYTPAFFNKASQNGYNDCDELFNWYFTNSIEAVKNTSLSDYATKEVMLTSLKKVIEGYKALTDEKLKEEYIGYDFKVEETKVTEFTNEQVKQYINNKSDKSKKTFENAKIDFNKIKEVKRYDYNLNLSSETTNTMSVYLIKIGSKWYVDNTALI